LLQASRSSRDDQILHDLHRAITNVATRARPFSDADAHEVARTLLEHPHNPTQPQTLSAHVGLLGTACRGAARGDMPLARRAIEQIMDIVGYYGGSMGSLHGGLLHESSWALHKIAHGSELASDQKLKEFISQRKQQLQNFVQAYDYLDLFESDVRDGADESDEFVSTEAGSERDVSDFVQAYDYLDLFESDVRDGVDESDEFVSTEAGSERDVGENSTETDEEVRGVGGENPSDGYDVEQPEQSSSPEAEKHAESLEEPVMETASDEQAASMCVLPSSLGHRSWLNDARLMETHIGLTKTIEFIMASNAQQDELQTCGGASGCPEAEVTPYHGGGTAFIQPS